MGEKGSSARPRAEGLSSGAGLFPAPRTICSITQPPEAI